MRQRTLGIVIVLALLTGCDVNDEHIPVDHKDDSTEYRVLIWDAVQQRVGSKLTPLPPDATLAGTWDVDFEMFGNRQRMFRYEFSTDRSMKIVTLVGNDQTLQTDSYSVKHEGQLSMSDETYHAATTERGELVLFNGDSSLVLIATKR